MNPLDPQEDKINKFNSPLTTRRSFLTRVMPACAVGCLGICAGVAFAEQGTDPPPDPEIHKFDKKFPYPLTLRQYMSRQLTKSTEPLKAIESEIGEKKLLRILHDFSVKKGEAQGEEFAKRHPDRDFSSYCDRFRTGQMQTIITYDIVEDSKEAFEMKVTECVLVQPMLELDAGKIGNAMLCDGDYGNARGYNPRIKLTRDKTLMLGDTCCNHRYVWTG
jgi:hypothetical protein